MQSYRAILVPLDGSPLSERALPLAVGIARRSHARLCLARVCSPAQPRDARAAAADRHELSELETLAKRLGEKWGVVSEIALLDDWSDGEESGAAAAPSNRIAAKLHSYARATGIELLVMTTHGRGGLSRLWLGSVADKLMQIAVVPILLTRPETPAARTAPDQSFEHILLPLDGSPLAEHAIAHALALGTPGQTVYTLVQILSPLVAEHVMPPYAVGLPMAAYEQLEQEARAYLQAIAQYIRPYAQAVQTRLVVADPTDAILEAAASQHADLIAMSTHGRSVLARTLLGSVADRVVRGADIPVIVFRPEGAAQWRHPDEIVPAVCPADLQREQHTGERVRAP